MQAKAHNLVVCFFFLFLINVSFYHLNINMLESYFRLIICNFSANICLEQFFVLFSFEGIASKTVIVFNDLSYKNQDLSMLSSSCKTQIGQ